jgi:DNA-binding transcriptional MerR regulator
MLEPSHNDELPPIPGKRYFAIGEVSELCAVKPHVLRYWEQEFPQLNPVKRRGNRRYYQRQDVLMIRQIRALLYDQGFTIGGARLRLSGDEAKDDTTQYKQLIRQTISELEDVLLVLRKNNKGFNNTSSFSKLGVYLLAFFQLVLTPSRGVAQSGSALAWGARGRVFESLRPDHIFQ